MILSKLLIFDGINLAMLLFAAFLLINKRLLLPFMQKTGLNNRFRLSLNV